MFKLSYVCRFSLPFHNYVLFSDNEFPIRNLVSEDTDPRSIARITQYEPKNYLRYNTHLLIRDLILVHNETDRGHYYILDTTDYVLHNSLLNTVFNINFSHKFHYYLNLQEHLTFKKKK